MVGKGGRIGYYSVISNERLVGCFGGRVGGDFFNCEFGSCFVGYVVFFGVFVFVKIIGVDFDKFFDYVMIEINKVVFKDNFFEDDLIFIGVRGDWVVLINLMFVVGSCLDFGFKVIF